MYQVVVALLVAVLYEQSTWRVKLVQGNKGLLGEAVILHVFEAGGRPGLCHFVPDEFLPGNLPCHFQFLLPLKLYNLMLDLLILIGLKILPTLPDCLPNLIKPSNNTFRNIQLKSTNVLIINIFDSIPDKILINTLTQQRTCFQYKPHFLLSQVFL